MAPPAPKRKRWRAGTRAARDAVRLKGTALTRFDSTAAWQSATRMVAANRDVLAAIAGVFFLLPMLAAAVFRPRVQLGEHMDQQQMADALGRYLADAMPLMLLLSLPMLVGTLTMLVVMLDPARPTVGAAIRKGLAALPSYLAAQFLSGMMLSLIWTALMLVLALALPAPLAVLASLAALAAPMARLVLIGPDIAVGGTRNPLAAIARSVRMTRGSVLGIVLYFVPAIALFLVVYGLVMMVAGVVLVSTTGGEAQQMLGEGLVAVLFTAAYTYLAAMTASTWRQLADAGDATAPRIVD